LHCFVNILAFSIELNTYNAEFRAKTNAHINEGVAPRGSGTHLVESLLGIGTGRKCNSERSRSYTDER